MSARHTTHGCARPWEVATGYRYQSNQNAPLVRDAERPLNLWLIIAMPLIPALFLATVSLLSGDHQLESKPLCSESCK